ncbi:hypothetical protein L2X99_14760 [Microbacterium sp. KUDC0406]|uniref:hypothetical protein n=1 Tax=Microbacterium sp. KUDC0406 TaxID=2909588 RepID=UPI001F3DB9BC|nr:hypothetical protein [Microbacterium sp. KUDC0406]UJP09656.1 hypothetical protein L2X99_14760 [Microbacterium sp. KUDC0406]
MIDITALDVSSPQEMWAWAVTTRALEDAVDALYTVGLLLDALADTTDWRVTAGQLVRARILAVRHEVQEGIVSVRELNSRLEAAMA